MRSRIMYIEDKSGELTGPCQIGRVTFSKTGRTLYYQGRSFAPLGGRGFKANFHIDTGEEFWISGPRRDGADGLYGRITTGQDVDADVAQAYWRDIRGVPQPQWPAGMPSEAFKRAELPTPGRSSRRLAAQRRSAVGRVE